MRPTYALGLQLEYLGYIAVTVDLAIVGQSTYALGLLLRYIE